jgi:hypothetical protein
VLYTTSVDSRIAAQTLTALRDFAIQQGWTVTHEAYGLAPLTVPARRRTGWRTVERLLVTDEVAGLAVPADYEAASTPAGQSALHAWLLSLPAFAAYLHTGRHSIPPSATPPTSRAPFAPHPSDRQWDHSWAMTRRACANSATTPVCG